MKPSIDLGLAISALSMQPGERRSTYQIAAFCGCSPQRIQQIEHRALRKIRAALYRDKQLQEELFDHGFRIK